MSVRVAIAGVTDQGRQRKRNEDTLLVDPAAGLALVADGMGGHRAGDVASRLAAAELHERIAAAPPASMSVSEGSRSPLGERMAEAVLRADARVRAEGVGGGDQEGMGTTLTALVLRPEDRRAVIGHVGDSRAYRYEGGRLRQITRDHTWVQEQIDAGRLSPGDAHGHPYSHVLAQAVGVGDDVVPDVIETEAAVGQLHLLCTDGLTNMLTETAMERILEDTLPAGLEATARALVDAANERGGADNITVVLARLENV